MEFGGNGGVSESGDNVDAGEPFQTQDSDCDGAHVKYGASQCQWQEEDKFSQICN